MDTYAKRIVLDVNADENHVVVHAKQGDKVNRQITIELQKDGVAFPVAGASKILFRMQKPDRNIIILDSTSAGSPITVSTNFYTVSLSEQCLTASGRAWCDIAFLDASGNVLSSAAFEMDIVPMPNGDTAESCSEWEALEEALEKIDTIDQAVEDAESAADRAEEAAEEAASEIPDVIEKIFDYTGNKEVEFIEDAYIDTSGTTVDINAPIASTTGFKYAVINCKYGDRFTLTSSGGSAPRAFCFIDENNNSLLVAPASRSYEDEIIVATPSAVKLIINAKNDEKSYYGEFIDARVSALERRNQTRLTDYVFSNPDRTLLNNAGTTNERTIYFHGNTFGEIGGAARTGSTFATYLITGDHAYVGGNNTSVLSRLTPANFIPITFQTENESLIAEVSYKGMRLRESASHNSGTLVVGTYDSVNETYELVNLTTNQALPYNEYRYSDYTMNITAACPNIVKNGNFALFYQAKYPDVTEEWSLNLKIYTNNFGSSSTRGNFTKLIGNEESTFIATSNHSVNDIIIILNNIYIVTQNITAGETIVDGTNVRYTTIGELITSILNSN